VLGARAAGRHAAASLVVALLPGRACVPLGDACLPALGLGWAACRAGKKARGSRAGSARASSQASCEPSRAYFSGS